LELLGKVEHLLGSAVERLFRATGKFAPLDLDRSIRRDLDLATKQVLGRLYAPNRVKIHLGDDDWAEYRTLLDEVRAEVTLSVVRHADDRQWSFLSPFELSFHHDPRQSRGEFRVELAFELPGEDRPAETSAVIAPGRGVTLILLTGSDGTERTPLATVVDGVTAVIGRDPGCDIVLDDPTVSARHARISRSARRSRFAISVAPTA